MTLVAAIGRDEVMSGLSRLKPRLQARGVTNLAIFGSRARGDHRPDSDLDILIDIEPNRKFSLLDLVGLSHIIGDELGIQANLFMRRSLEPQMLASIRPDLIEIFHD